jgi:hypothetical protein
MSHDTEALTNSLPTKKRPGQDELIAKFYQTIKDKLTSVFVKLFHEIVKEVAI